MKVELLQHGELAVVLQAIATCHGKKAASSPVLKKVIAAGHESVLEHWSATFAIEGISRACSQQLERHRLASYSEMSQRVVRLEGALCIKPKCEPAAGDILTEAYASALSYYQKLLECGMSPEDARYVLPLGTSTSLVLTMNARELRHFFRLRLSPEAQWEIRELAARMRELCWKAAPDLFEEIG